MMNAIDLQTIADATNGQLLGKNNQIKNITIDSREVGLGDMFVAVKGEHDDGHGFVEMAAKKGAIAALVERQQAVSIPQLIVQDTRQALVDIAKLNRQMFKGKVLAITGSSGKTTSKNMLSGILSTSGNVCATKGNFNNEIGLPLTMQAINDSHEFAVLEMGAAKAGDIAYLADIAQPSATAVTNIGVAHIEGFGSLEETASTKAAIYDALPEEGWAVVNLDDDFSNFFVQRLKTQKDNGRLLSFSMRSAKANFFASDIRQGESGLTFTMNINTDAEQQAIPIALNFLGQHNIYNALLAVAMAKTLDITNDKVAQGLSMAYPERGRLSLCQSANNLTLIDDSYNANPASMEAAIDVLTALSEKLQKSAILVVGDMAELGVESIELHRHVGRYAAKQGIQRLFAVGEYAGTVVSSYDQQQGLDSLKFSSKQALAKYLLSDICRNSLVLVKGSRNAAMDEVVDLLAVDEEGAFKGVNAC